MAEHQHIPPDIGECLLDIDGLVYEPFGEGPLSDERVSQMKELLTAPGNDRLVAHLSAEVALQDMQFSVDTIVRRVMPDSEHTQSTIGVIAALGATYGQHLATAIRQPGAEWSTDGPQALPPEGWGKLIDKQSCVFKAMALQNRDRARAKAQTEGTTE